VALTWMAGNAATALIAAMSRCIIPDLRDEGLA
jgi:hypothetical protein